MLPANYPFRAAPEEIHAPPTTIDGPEAYLESSRAQRLLDDAHGVPSRKVHPNLLPKVDDSAKYSASRTSGKGKKIAPADHRSRKAAEAAQHVHLEVRKHVFKPLGLAIDFVPPAGEQYSSRQPSEVNDGSGAFVLSPGQQSVSVRGGAAFYSSADPAAAAIVLDAGYAQDGATSMPLGAASPNTDPLLPLSGYRQGAPQIVDGGPILPGFVATSNRSRPGIPDGSVITSTGRSVGGVRPVARAKENSKAQKLRATLQAQGRIDASLVRVPASGPRLQETALRPVQPAASSADGTVISHSTGAQHYSYPTQPQQRQAGQGGYQVQYQHSPQPMPTTAPMFYVPGSPSASLAAFSVLSPAAQAAGPYAAYGSGSHMGQSNGLQGPQYGPAASASMENAGTAAPQWQQYVQDSAPAATGSGADKQGQPRASKIEGTQEEQEADMEAITGLEPALEKIMPPLPSISPAPGTGYMHEPSVSVPPSPTSEMQPLRFTAEHQSDHLTAPLPGHAASVQRAQTPLFDWSAFSSVSPVPRILYVPPVDAQDHARLVQLIRQAKGFESYGPRGSKVLSAAMSGTVAAQTEASLPYVRHGLPVPLRHAYPTSLLLRLVHDLSEEISACGRAQQGGMTSDTMSAWLWFLSFAIDARVIEDHAHAVVLAKAGLLPEDSNQGSGSGRRSPSPVQSRSAVSAAVLDFLLRLEQDVQQTTAVPYLSAQAGDSSATDAVTSKHARAVLPHAVPLAGVALEHATIRLTRKLLAAGRLPGLECATLFVRCCLAFAGWGKLNASASVMRSVISDLQSDTAQAHVLTGSVEEAMNLVEAILLEPLGPVPPVFLAACDAAGVCFGGIRVTPDEARTRLSRAAHAKKGAGAGAQATTAFDKKAWSMASQVRTRAVSLHALESLLSSPTSALAIHFGFIRECMPFPPSASAMEATEKALLQHEADKVMAGAGTPRSSSPLQSELRSASPSLPVSSRRQQQEEEEDPVTGFPIAVLQDQDLLHTDEEVEAIFGVPAVDYALQHAEDTAAEPEALPSSVRVAVLLGNRAGDGPLLDPDTGAHFALHAQVPIQVAEDAMTALAKAARRSQGPSAAIRTRHWPLDASGRRVRPLSALAQKLVTQSIEAVAADMAAEDLVTRSIEDIAGELNMQPASSVVKSAQQQGAAEPAEGVLMAGDIEVAEDDDDMAVAAAVLTGEIEIAEEVEGSGADLAASGTGNTSRPASCRPGTATTQGGHAQRTQEPACPHDAQVRAFEQEEALLIERLDAFYRQLAARALEVQAALGRISAEVKGAIAGGCSSQVQGIYEWVTEQVQSMHSSLSPAAAGFSSLAAVKESAREGQDVDTYGISEADICPYDLQSRRLEAKVRFLSNKVASGADTLAGQETFVSDGMAKVQHHVEVAVVAGGSTQLQEACKAIIKQVLTPPAPMPASMRASREGQPAVLEEFMLGGTVEVFEEEEEPELRASQ